MLEVKIEVLELIVYREEVLHVRQEVLHDVPKQQSHGFCFYQLRFEQETVEEVGGVDELLGLVNEGVELAIRLYLYTEFISGLPLLFHDDIWSKRLQHTSDALRLHKNICLVGVRHRVHLHTGIFQVILGPRVHYERGQFLCIMILWVKL